MLSDYFFGSLKSTINTVKYTAGIALGLTPWFLKGIPIDFCLWFNLLLLVIYFPVIVIDLIP